MADEPTNKKEVSLNVSASVSIDVLGFKADSKLNLSVSASDDGFKLSANVEHQNPVVKAGVAVDANTSSQSASISPKLEAGDSGSYGELISRGTRGDNLTPHHMPQAAAEFTTKNEGGALVLSGSEHLQTRTFGGKGIASLKADAGLSFRQTLFKDIRDIRGLFGSAYDKGLKNLLNFYKKNFPDLMKKP